MKTNRPCHSVGCGQRAVQTCAICTQRYCGEHLLRAYFLGASLGSSAPVRFVFDVCQTCLEQEIREQHVHGRDLSHWRKVG